MSKKSRTLRRSILSVGFLLAVYLQAFPGLAAAQTGQVGSKGFLTNLASNRAVRLRASFTYTPAYPSEGQAVQFTDMSTGSPTSWLWEFGDGSTSGDRNPSHIYMTSGFRKVALSVSNSTGSKKVTRTITVMPAPASASFVYSPTSPTVGQTVQFADTTSGDPSSWSWDFGDGGTSNVKNPNHVFAAPSSYSVSLMATNSAGSKKTTRTISVTNASLPVSSFAYSPAAPVTGQSVQFTDTSAGSPTAWQWNFGDGSTSTAQNPTHAFSTAGSKTVALTVSNASGSNSATRTVTVAVALTASFTYSPPSPVAGQSVQFTDASAGSPTSWQWNFGDGSTSTAQIPPTRSARPDRRQ